MFVPRVYAVTLAAEAETAAIDWFELITGTTSSIMLLALDIGQTTETGDAMEEQINWYVKRFTGAYTSGSGGNTGVARTPLHPGDAAATFTAESSNTTKATGGTSVDLWRSSFNLRSGLQMIWTPETAPQIAISSAMVIGFENTPADSVTWSGTAIVGELLP